MRTFIFILSIFILIMSAPAYDWNMVYSIDESVHGSAYFWNPPYYNIYFTGTKVIGFNDEGYFEIDTGYRVTHAVQLEEDIMILTDPDMPNPGVYWLDVETSTIIDTFLQGDFYCLVKDQTTEIIYAGCDTGHYSKQPDEEEFDYIYNEIEMYNAAFFGRYQVYSGIHYGSYRIFYSDNSGASIQESEFHILLEDIAYGPNDVIYATGVDESNIQGIYMSEDYGANWSRINDYAYFNSIAVDCYGNLFASSNAFGSTYTGVSARHNETFEMILLNEGLPTDLVNQISCCPTLNHQHMIACTNEGVYIIRNYQNELPIEGTASIEKRAFGLRNYPNPFNPSTTISFELGEDENITINIFNIDGQLINTLVDNKLFRAGSHSTVWDGRAADGSIISSGIYFCRLKSTKTENVVKLLLLK